MAKILLSSEEQKYLADSEYLQKEVRRLEGEKARLTNEVNNVSKKISTLKEEQIAFEEKAKEIIAEAQKIAEQKITKAQEIEDKANEKRSGIEAKLGELADRQIYVENLVKSNQGLQKNLDIQNKDLESKVSKLKNLASLINETLKSL